MTASLYRKYNAFSDRESAQTEQKHRTMTCRASRPCILLLTMVHVILETRESSQNGVNALFSERRRC